MEDEVRTAEILVRGLAGIVLAFLKAFSGKYRLKEILPEASLHLRLSCQRFRKSVGLSSYIRCLLLHFLHGLLQLLGELGAGLEVGRGIVLHGLFHGRDAFLQRLQDSVHRSQVLVRELLLPLAEKLFSLGGHACDHRLPHALEGLVIVILCL